MIYVYTAYPTRRAPATSAFDIHEPALGPPPMTARRLLLSLSRLCMRLVKLSNIAVRRPRRERAGGGEADARGERERSEGAGAVRAGRAGRAAAAACVVAVDADEIRRLGKRFRKLDLDNSGALSIDEFMSLPELQQNPLVQRVIDIFDADGNGEVSPFPLPITFRAPPSSRSVFFYSSISGCRA